MSLIRKRFQMSNTHVVRNCYSERCKYSLHSHTAILDCYWHANELDNAMMALDFGLVSKFIKPIIRAFDNSVLMWKKDNKEYRDFIKSTTDRWIELPFSPSAEMLAKMFVYNFDKITSDLRSSLKNGEDKYVSFERAEYHETRTGFARTYEQELHWEIQQKKELETLLDFESFEVGDELKTSAGESVLVFYSSVDNIEIKTPEMQVPI